MKVFILIPFTATTKCDYKSRNHQMSMIVPVVSYYFGTFDIKGLTVDLLQ